MTDRLLYAGLNLRNDIATGDVVEALRSAGIRSIVLKGPAMRRWLYEESVPRPSIDIDLLVDPRRLDDARAVLRALGYRSLGDSRISRERALDEFWEHASPGLALELHYALFGVREPSDEAWEVLAAEAEEELLDSRPVEVLSPRGRALQIALHAVQHGPDDPEPLRDLEQALRAVPQDVWEGAAALAVRLDAGEAFAAGLRMSPDGAELADRLQLPEGMPLEVALRVESGPPLTEGLAWLSQVRGPRAKAAFVIRHVFPPPSYMRLAYPRARRSSLGLATSYAARPFWAARHAWPAARAVRRLRAQPVHAAPTPGRARRISAAVAAPGGLSLLVRMLGWSLLLPGLKRALPLPRLVRLMALPARNQTRRPDDERRILDLARWVYRARTERSRDNCLERSLLAYRYLTGVGARPTLVVGMRKDDEAVRGHAWLTVDGTPAYEDGHDLAAYRVVLQFGPDGYELARGS